MGELWAYEAEVKAILHALIFYRQFQLCHVLIESDSSLEIGWVNCKLNRLWKLIQYLNLIDLLCIEVDCIGVNHIFRESNHSADFLAKSGTNRSSPIWAIFTNVIDVAAQKALLFLSSLQYMSRVTTAGAPSFRVHVRRSFVVCWKGLVITVSVGISSFCYLGHQSVVWCFACSAFSNLFSFLVFSYLSCCFSLFIFCCCWLLLYFYLDLNFPYHERVVIMNLSIYLYISFLEKEYLINMNEWSTMLTSFYIVPRKQKWWVSPWKQLCDNWKVHN